MNGFIGSTLAVARRTIRTSFTNPAVFMPALIAPIFMLLTFVGAFSALGNLPLFNYAGGYLAFTYTFMVFQAAGFSGTIVGPLVADDFQSRFIRRMFLAMPNRRAIVFGYALASVLMAFVVIGACTIVAWLLGLKILGSPLQFMGLIGLALLFNLAAALWAAGLAMIFKSPEGGMMANMPVLTGIFLAPVYVPLGLLQGWVYTVASVNPVTTLLESGRSLVAGQPNNVLAAFLIALMLVLVVTAFSLMSLRRAEQGL